MQSNPYCVTNIMQPTRMKPTGGEENLPSMQEVSLYNKEQVRDFVRRLGMFGDKADRYADAMFREDADGKFLLGGTILGHEFRGVNRKDLIDELGFSPQDATDFIAMLKNLPLKFANRKPASPRYVWRQS